MSFAVRRRIAPSAATFVGRGQDGTLFIDLPFGRLLVCLDSVTGLAELGLHGLVLSPASLAAGLRLFVCRLVVTWFAFLSAMKGERRKGAASPPSTLSPASIAECL